MYMHVLQLHNLVLVHPGEHEDITIAVIRPIGMDTPNWLPLHPLAIRACDCHSYYFLKLVNMGLV